MFFNKLKKIAAGALILAMAATVFTGCGKDPVVDDSSNQPDQETQTPAADDNTAAGTDDSGDVSAASGGTFTYAIAGDPGANVNVITTSDRFGLMTIKMVYSPLCMYNADGINWFLATGVETSEDQLTHTFTLRDDVVWSDGTPFTADDVIFTYEKMAEEKNNGWAYSQLVYPEGSVKFEKVDDHTVAFTMPFVNASSVEMLSNIFIMPKHIYENVEDFENNDVNVTPVGTGPYVMSQYEAGSYVKFDKNSDYFLGAPSIDTIIFRVIENADTAKMAIQSGEVNAWIATPSEVSQMQLEANELTTHPYSEGRVGYMMINANRVKDQKVRQAILFALNKADMNNACFLSEENYEIPWSFLPNISEFFTEDVEKYEQDAEKSKQLLKEAGVDKLTLNLGYSGSDTVQGVQAVMIQEQLKAVGIDVTLSAVDGTALSLQMKDPDNEYDLYLGGYIMGIDPDTFASLFETGAPWNYMYYENQTINDLFSEGRKETDTEKRKEIYTKLQQELQDTACFYPITSNKRILVISDNVKGIEEAKLVPVYTFEDTSRLYME